MPKDIAPNISDYEWDENSNRGKLASVNAHIVNDWLVSEYSYFVVIVPDYTHKHYNSVQVHTYGRSQYSGSYRDQYSALIAGIECAVTQLEKRLFYLQNA